MGNIVLLDDLTINKIAAGEFIERPASVVKEVVENAIDAGATNISIEIKNGGISYIRITDNGKGFEPDDMEIAFERHATSKIRKAEDIENITSMGFRGEALASIAAISKVELVSKTEKNNIGNRIIIEGGKVLLKEEAGCPKGSTITIENLFYNTPVRYKFLKKDFTESGYIEDAVTRIALVNPDIAIKFINSGKTVIQTSGNGNLKDVVYGIYGKDTAENIINVDYSFEDMKINGVVGKPSIARSNRANQLFFVNKRFVKDKTLTSAAEQAFKGLLQNGKYGFLVLNIEMDPHKLDVNVHPAKLEVRFQEENKVFKLVYHAIQEALSQENNIGEKNTMIEENYKKNYLDEFQKNEEKATESKGLSGFFKNMKNKNEFVTNDHNLVEELYNDKIKHEHNEYDAIVNDIPEIKPINEVNETKKEEVADDIDSMGVDYKFSSISTPIKRVDPQVIDNYINEYRMRTASEKYDNLIVKEDGGIELKSFDKKEEVKEEKPSYQTTKISDETKIYDSSFNVVDAAPKGVSDDTLVNFSWTDAKVDSLKEQINELTANKDTAINNTENKVENEIENNNENTQEIDTATTMNLLAQTIDANKSEIVKSLVTEKTGINENEEIAKVAAKVAEKNEVAIETAKTEKTSTEPDSKFEEMYEKMFGKPVIKFKEEEPVVEEKKAGYTFEDKDFKDVKNISLFNNKEVFNTPAYKFIGVVFNSNIIIEYENEMYIIDQRVANERILYEKIKKNYYSETEKDSQLMLLPDVIELSHKQMGIAKDNINLFKKAGFDVEIFGENTVKLTGVPGICIDLDTRQLFLDILDEVNTVARTATQEIEEKFIETIASKTAEKAKIALTEPEVNGLMHNLLTLQDPFTCPNGKQAAIRMSRVDIEKKFSRR